MEVNVTESFDSFVARLSSHAASTDAITRGVAIEPFRGPQGDGLETTSDKHILTLCSKHPSRFGVRHGLNKGSYIKQPGALSLVPVGAYPVIRAETEFDLIVCAFDSALVNGLDSELEPCQNGELRLQVNFMDAAARQLMTLLLADVNEGSTTEKLYRESLAQALAVRMLSFGRRTKPPSKSNGSYGLPGHLVRRVIDRMRCFDCDLSLEALANESGYSRVHFVRMFKAATGYSPHNYLLNLRLERVRELLKNRSMSLIDIALESGFASHSHMSRLFHKFVGVTPSAYRRGIRL